MKTVAEVRCNRASQEVAPRTLEIIKYINSKWMKHYMSCIITSPIRQRCVQTVSAGIDFGARLGRTDR